MTSPTRWDPNLPIDPPPHGPEVRCRYDIDDLGAWDWFPEVDGPVMVCLEHEMMAGGLAYTGSSDEPCENWRHIMREYRQMFPPLEPSQVDVSPLRWRKPRHVVVAPGVDLFDARTPAASVAKLFAVMAMARKHTFEVVTEHPDRMRDALSSKWFWNEVRRSVVRDLDRVAEAVGLVRDPLPNVWLGTVVTCQEDADERVPDLLATQAAVRFLRCEPLLGPVNLYPHMPMGTHDPRESDEWGIDWIVAGGQTGPDARPTHPDWIRELRDMCADQMVPFRFTGWGEWVEAVEPQIGDEWLLPDRHGRAGHWSRPWKPDNVGAAAGRWSRHRDVVMRRLGKRTAGAELDGRVWDETPAVSS